MDLVGLNRSRNEVLFGECKWTSGRVDRSLFYDLVEKSREFRWRNDQRKDVFAIFSRSGFSGRLRDIALERDDLLLFDLEDIMDTFPKN